MIEWISLVKRIKDAAFEKKKHCLFSHYDWVVVFHCSMQLAGKKLWWITKQPCSSTQITQWRWWTWVGICVQQEIFRKQSKLTRGLYWDTEHMCDHRWPKFTNRWVIKYQLFMNAYPVRRFVHFRRSRPARYAYIWWIPRIVILGGLWCDNNNNSNNKT